MRIVSLLPSATEILFALGLGDQVVGVTHECDYPIEALAKPRLTASSLPPAGGSAEIDRHVRANLHSGSSIYKLDAALLEDLAPDLIITQELCPVCAVSYELVRQATKRLKGDPRVVSLEPSSLEDVYATISSLGQLTGTAGRAATLLTNLRSRQNRLRELTAGSTRPRTLVLEWTDPPMSGGHWTPGLVELTGGEPMLSHPGANSQRLDWKAIIAAQPDVILVAPCGYSLEVALRETRALDSIQLWRDLDAVRLGRVAVIDGNQYVNRPGPRLLDTAEIFCAILHPELVGVTTHARGWQWLARKEKGAKV